MAKITNVLGADLDGHRVLLDDGRILTMTHGGPIPSVGDEFVETEVEQLKAENAEIREALKESVNLMVEAQAEDRASQQKCSNMEKELFAARQAALSEGVRSGDLANQLNASLKHIAELQQELLEAPAKPTMIASDYGDAERSGPVGDALSTKSEDIENG